ncbi:hypothetical protein COLO4_00150 [Corchorus olitorius]|uniref:Uncharacterized protein n=1 Tax=Corchorus olitorius TaxID=93759 RepID=A0A1R3L4H2_9ROSI|nr:hypothetical protein COLO4_00150 [Corchorus olitorius]
MNMSNHVRDKLYQAFDSNKDNRLSDLQMAAEMARRELERLGKAIHPTQLADGHGGLAIPLISKYLGLLEASAKAQQPSSPEAVVNKVGVYDLQAAVGDGENGLEVLLDQVRQCWASGCNEVHLHGLRQLNPQFREVDLASIQEVWGSHAEESILESVRRPSAEDTKREERLKMLRRNAPVSATASQLLRALERAGNFTLLEPDQLFDMLLIRLVDGKAAEYRAWPENSPRLFFKLKEAGAVLERQFNEAQVKTFALPEYLDDLFMEYAKQDPQWQEGPGCYGPVWKGNVLISEGISPAEFFRDPSVKVGEGSVLKPIVDQALAEHLCQQVVSALEAGFGKQHHLQNETLKSLAGVQRLLEELNPPLIQVDARAGTAESFASTSQVSPMAEKFNAIVKPSGSIQAAVVDYIMRSGSIPGTEGVYKVLCQPEHQLVLVDVEYFRKFQCPSTVVWNAALMVADTMLDNPEHEQGIVTFTLPKGSMDSIESIESKPCADSAGVSDLLINGQRGRLMIDLGKYQFTEDGVTQLHPLVRSTHPRRNIMTTDNQIAPLRVIATMHRGQSKEIIMVRRYSYFDTAMPRMLQLAITQCNEGDFIEFASIEEGWQLGILRILKGGKFEMEMSELVKAAPSLLKLMSEDTNWTNNLVTSALQRGGLS